MAEVRESDLKCKRFPVVRGCTKKGLQANGSCYCDGSCNEVVGYVDLTTAAYAPVPKQTKFGLPLPCEKWNKISK